MARDRGGRSIPTKKKKGQVGGAVPPRKWGRAPGEFKPSSGKKGTVSDHEVPRKERERQARKQADRTFAPIRTPTEQQYRNVKATPKKQLPSRSGLAMAHRAGIIPDPSRIPGIQRLATESRSLGEAFQYAPAGLVQMLGRTGRDIAEAKNSLLIGRSGADADFNRTRQTLREQYEGTKGIVQDPLKPGNTSLFLAGVLRPVTALGASGVSRALAVKRAGSTDLYHGSLSPLPERGFHTPEGKLGHDLPGIYASPAEKMAKHYGENVTKIPVNKDLQKRIIKTTDPLSISQKSAIARAAKDLPNDLSASAMAALQRPDASHDSFVKDVFDGDSYEASRHGKFWENAHEELTKQGFVGWQRPRPGVKIRGGDQEYIFFDPKAVNTARTSPSPGRFQAALSRPKPPPRIFDDPAQVKGDKTLKTSKEGAFRVSETGQSARLVSVAAAKERQTPRIRDLEAKVARGEELTPDEQVILDRYEPSPSKKILANEDGTFTESGGFSNELVKSVEAPEGFIWREDPKDPGKFNLEEDIPSQGYYSKSKDIEYAQRGIDALRRKHPNLRLPGPGGFTNLEGRAKFERDRNKVILDARRELNNELAVRFPPEESNPMLTEAAAVEIDFRMKGGEDPTTIIPEVAQKYEINLPSLKKVYEGRGDEISQRILSNQEVWRQGYGEYDTALMMDDKKLLESVRSEISAAWANEKQGFRENRGNIGYWSRGVNNAMRLGIFYLAPKYAAPNLLGNFTLNFIQQGKSLPVAWKNAARAMKKEGPTNLAHIDRGMGLGAAQGLRVTEALLPSAQGLLGPTTNMLAHGWSHILDKQFRRAAWMDEAAKAGYKTPEARKRLLNDSELQNQYLEVTRRARDEILDYQRLGKKEKVLSEFLFIYPFTKASTVYLGQFMAHHPMKAAAATVLGQAGEEDVKKQLGDVPSFLTGAIPSAGGPTGMKVSSPDAFSPIGPGINIMNTAVSSVAGGATRRESPLGLLHPAIRAYMNAAQNYDPFFGRQLDPAESDVGQTVGQLWGQLPQVRAVEGMRNPTEGNPDVMYPMSRRDWAKWIGGGTVIPRPINPKESVSRAQEEQRSLMSKEERTRFSIKTKSDEWLKEAKRIGAVPKTATGLHPETRSAIEALKGRQLYRQRATERKGDELTAKERIKSDLDFLRDKGVIDRDEYDSNIQDLADVTDEDVKNSRYLYDTYFRDMYGDTLSDDYNFFKERGAKVERFQLTG